MNIQERERLAFLLFTLGTDIGNFIRLAPSFEGDGKLASQIGKSIGEIQGVLEIPLPEKFEENFKTS